MTDVLTFHNDVARTGIEYGAPASGFWSKRYEVEIPGRSPPADLEREVDGSVPLWYPSAVRGAPLFLNQWIIQEGRRHGQAVDMVIVATSDGEVFAYDHAASQTGTPPPLLWKQSLGPSRYHIAIPAGSTKPTLSNIPRPVGITSTPVADKACRRLFVVACHQEASMSGSYAIYALEIDTGAVLQRAKLVDPGAPSHITFDGHGLDQRGGLNLVAGRIYIPFSDLYAYDAEDLPHPGGGWIVSCKANDLNHQRYFSVTRTVHGGGIWADGGVSADSSNRLYAATGTGLSGVGQYNPTPQNPTPSSYWSHLKAQGQHPGDRGDFFMSVVQLAYTGDQLQLKGWYQPGPTGGTGFDIGQIQDSDNDLGSCSVLVLPTIGERHLVITSSKDGDAYLLDANNALGHYDGHVDRVTIFQPDENGHREGASTPALWQRKNGDHIVFLSGRLHLAALKIAPPAMAGGHWITPFYPGTFFSDIKFQSGNWAGSPVIAPVSGVVDDALVWVAEPCAGGLTSDDADTTTDGGVYAIHATTGKVAFDSTLAPANSAGPMPHYPGLTAAGAFVFVANYRGFVCYELAR